MKRYLLLFLLFSFLSASEHIEVCFTATDQSSICSKDRNNTILLPNSFTFLEKIDTIQQSIRGYLDEDKDRTLILIAEGFEGTLLTIAQTNMLMYYRKRISGLVLKDAEVDLYRRCKKELTQEYNATCYEIKTYQEGLKGKASEIEVLKALSPYYQIDWNTPKVVLLDTNKTLSKKWIETLDANSIPYMIARENTSKIGRWCLRKKSSKIEPKSSLTKPSHHGPLIRYHLGKIEYTAKNEIEIIENISYGNNALQTYDVYHRKNSENNPLFIYVHGGGWAQGDKATFNDLCMQYADMGFTAININYRLLNLPTITMKEMINDVKTAIEAVYKNKYFHPMNGQRSVVMAESAGTQLAFLAMSKLDKSYKINAAILNSVVSNLKLYNTKKQTRLSGFKEKKKRDAWVKSFSPLAKGNLESYKVPTLVLHSIHDRVVIPKHLEELDIQSVIYADNIKASWISNGVHPIAPGKRAMQPSYNNMEMQMEKFIETNIGVVN